MTAPVAPTSPITQDVMTIPRKAAPGLPNLVGMSRDAMREALIAAGHPGMAVPSFARGARHNSLNIILWEWGPNSAAQLRLVDDETRLGGGPSRATGGGDNPP